MASVIPLPSRVAQAARAPQSDYDLVQVFNCDPTGPRGACDQVARGVAPIIEFAFPGPGDYQVLDLGSYVELSFEHSAALLPDLSSLSVLLNGAVIPNSAAGATSPVRLDASNSSRTTLRIDLPAEALRRDFNRISLQFYQRIQLPCDDPNNPALKSKVYESTKIHYQYAPGFPLRSDRPPLELSAFPYPFFKAGYTRIGEVVFVLPESPSLAELSAAASMAAAMGNVAGTQPLHVDAITVDKLTDDVRSGNDLIAIGTPARNPLVERLARGSSTGAPGGAETAPSSGILALAPSPFDATHAALAVTGANDAAVLRAAYALASPQTRARLSGDSALVSRSPNTPSTEPGAAPGSAFEHSLADLGLRDTTVSGDGVHTLSTTFQTPPANTGADALLRLTISHSPLLDARRSHITVSINGIAVASEALNDGNVSRGRAEIKIPGKAVHPGLNQLALNLATFPQSTDEANSCVGGGTDSAWATLWSDSTIDIGAGSGVPQPIDLAYYPYPFLDQGSLASTFIVVTTQQDSLQRGLETAADLGRKSRGASFVTGMVRPEDLDATIKKNANLIVVGLPAQNALIREINERLPLPFGAENGVISDTVSAPGAALPPAARGRSGLGFAEIIPSPYNRRRTMVIETGTTPDGLLLARIALGNPLPSGNILVATGTYEPPTVLSLGVRTVAGAGPGSRSRTVATYALPSLTVLVGLVAAGLAGVWVYQASRASRKEP